MGQGEGYKWLSLGRAPAQKGHGVSSDQWGHREEESLPTCPASWPASPGAGLSKKSWGGGVGLLYLCLSDKFKMSPLFLQEPSGQQELHCMWVSKVPTRLKHPLKSSSMENWPPKEAELESLSIAWPS